MLEKEKQDLEASCLKVLGFWKLLLLKRSSFPTLDYKPNI